MSMIPPSADRNALSRLGAMGMGQGAPDAGKAPMADVHYRQGSPEASCDRCKHFQPPDACEIVAGRIDPQGMCDAYEPLAAPAPSVGPPPAQ